MLDAICGREIDGLLLTSPTSSCSTRGACADRVGGGCG